MRKTLWKLPPYQCFEVDALEGWLNEMSRSGWQLETRFGPICYFRREDSFYRYCVDLHRRGDDFTEDERLDAYRAMGWEFVTDYTKYAEIYRSADLESQLHTDEDLLRNLVKRTCRQRLMLCICYLYFTIRELWLLKDLLSNPWTTLSNPPYALVFSATVAFVLILLINISETLVTCRQLKKKGFLHSTVHTPQRAHWGIFWWVCRLLLIVLFVITMIMALLLSA